MSFTVLFTMLFQTIHSYEHVYKQLTEEHCEHNDTAHKHQITHFHAIDNTCHVCHFAFSNYIPNTFSAINFNKLITETSNVFFYTQTSVAFFKGSLFALRGPPFLA